MHIIRHLDALPAAARGGAVSIGNFDGVHRGHVAIVRRLLERAEAVGGPAIVFTFDPHPVRLLRPEQCPPPLTWTERKAELLAAQGVDWIVAYPTDEALLQLSADEFFRADRPRRAGCPGAGRGPELLLRPQSRRHDRAARPARGRGRHLARRRAAGRSRRRDRLQLASRELIRAGNVEQAKRAARRRRIAFAAWSRTAPAAGRRSAFPPRISSAIDTLLPAQGVYAGRAWVGERTLAGRHQSGPQPHVRRRDDSRRSPPRRPSTNRSTASRWRLTSWPGCGTFGRLIRRQRWSSN